MGPFKPGDRVAWVMPDDAEWDGKLGTVTTAEEAQKDWSDTERVRPDTEVTWVRLDEERHGHWCYYADSTHGHALRHHVEADLSTIDNIEKFLS